MPFMLLAAKAKFWRGRNVHQTFVPLQHSSLLLLRLLLPWTKILKAWFWQLSLEPLSLPAKRQSADCFMKGEFKNKLLDISNLNKMECMMGLKVFIRTLWHRQWYCLNWNACRFRTLKIDWGLKGRFLMLNANASPKEICSRWTLHSTSIIYSSGLATTALQSSNQVYPPTRGPNFQ